MGAKAEEMPSANSVMPANIKLHRSAAIGNSRLDVVTPGQRIYNVT